MAVTAVTQAVGSYVDSVWYWVHDSSGYMVSGTGTAPAAGNQDGGPCLQIPGAQNFPFTAQDPDRPSQLGDGGAIARFINRPTELPEAAADFGALEFDFSATAATLTVVTLGGGKVLGGQPYAPTYRDMGLMAVSQAKSIETSNTGSMWEARIMLSCNVFAKGRDSYNTSSLPTYQYSMVANYASAYPWGHAFAAGDEGDTQFIYLDITWPYRPFVQRWTGDGTEVTWNLTKNIAEDSADNIVAFDNGVALTWVTGAPSGATEFGITESTTDTLVTFTANPGNGDKLVAFYGWS